MEPRNLTPEDLAAALGLPLTRIDDILEGQCVITPGEALRLGRLFGTDPRFWMHLQADCLLEEARQEQEATVNARVRPLPQPS